MDRTGNLLGAFAQAISDGAISAMGAASGLSASAVAALTTLSQYPNTSVAVLAEVLGLSHSATVRLADDLERKGYVERTRDGEDRRAVGLLLRRPGETLARKMSRARLAFLERVVLELDAGSRASFDRALEVMLVSLTVDRASANFMCRFCDEEACGGDACPVEQCARAKERV